MKKLYLKFNNNDYEQIIPISPEENSDLNLIYMSLNPIHDWISIIEKNEEIHIGIDFLNDVAQLTLSKENYNQIITKWNNNIDHPAPYLIISQENNGKINLEVKESLSLDDLSAIEQDKQAKIKLDQQSETVI